jgi:hypothetical protein
MSKKKEKPVAEAPKFAPPTSNPDVPEGFCVLDELPPPNVYLWTFSAVFGSYHVAKWTPATGWQLPNNGGILQAITHWWGFILPAPYEETNEFNATIGKLYGYEAPSRRGLFG